MPGPGRGGTGAGRSGLKESNQLRKAPAPTVFGHQTGLPRVASSLRRLLQLGGTVTGEPPRTLRLDTPDLEGLRVLPPPPTTGGAHTNGRSARGEAAATATTTSASAPGCPTITIAILASRLATASAAI
jgi:hypothetical protein